MSLSTTIDKLVLHVCPLSTPIACQTPVELERCQPFFYVIIYFQLYKIDRSGALMGHNINAYEHSGALKGCTHRATEGLRWLSMSRY